MKHLYAKLDHTPIYSDAKTSSQAFTFLSKGAWIGVVATKGEFYSVITTEGNGFVRIAETYQEDAFKLRVLASANGDLKYAV